MTATGRTGGDTFAPLAVPTFFALWLGTILSNFGTMIQSVGAAWLMTTLTATPSMVALVQTATTLPIMLLGLPAGALADLYDRRLIMICAQVLVVVASSALAVLGFVGELTPWLLLAFTFILGIGAALNAPTWQASLGDIVPRASLPSAVALNSLSFNSARSVGPALGGVIVGLLGAPIAFLLNALATLPLLAILLRWRRPARERDLPTEPMGAAMWSGVRYVSLSLPIMDAVTRGVAMGFFAGAMWALLPLLARNQLHGGPTLFGVLLGVFGVGALVGAVSSGILRKRFGVDALWTGSALAFAIGNIVMGASELVWLTALALLAAGGAWLIGLSTLISRVQLSSPRWVVGRAMAIYQLTAFGALAIGSALWGIIANQFGLPATLYVAGTLFFVTTLALRLRPLREVPAELDPAIGDVTTPNLQLDHNTAPVVVTVNYRVSEADVARFLELMRSVSRMRRRDGALGWELLQDIDAPELWVERFHSRNWLEHRRRRSRAIKGDQLLRDEIGAFVVEDGIKVRRYVRRER